MTMGCFTAHEDYIKDFGGGIRICLLCAAKHEMAQTAKAILLKLKMMDVIYEPRS